MGREELKVVVEGDEAQWYALRVVPQKEYVVAYLLRKQGVRTFVPTETTFRRRTRYQKTKAEFAHPEIPSCVFAGFDGAPAWYHLLRNSLILGVEGRNGEPWQFDLEKLFKFFAHSVDGCMTIIGDKEDDRYGMRLVHVQGRGLVRSPTTQARTISNRRKEADTVVVEPMGRRARLLQHFVKIPQPLRQAA